MSEKIKMLDKVRILKSGVDSLSGCIGRINSIEGGEYLAQLGDGSGGWYSPDHLEIMDKSVPIDASPADRGTYADLLALAREQSTTIIDLQEQVWKLREGMKKAHVAIDSCRRGATGLSLVPGPGWAPVKGEWVVRDGDEPTVNSTGIYEHDENGIHHVYRPSGPRKGLWYECYPWTLRPASNAEVAAVMDLKRGDDLVMWRKDPTSKMEVGGKCFYENDTDDDETARVTLPDGYEQLINYTSLHLVSRAAKSK